MRAKHAGLAERSGACFPSKIRGVRHPWPAPGDGLATMRMMRVDGRAETCGWLLVSSWPSKPAQAGSMPVARSIQTFGGQELPESATEDHAEFLRCVTWEVRDLSLGWCVVCPSTQAVWQHRGCQPTGLSRPEAVFWDMRQARRFMGV